ncbi:nucleotide pyrophosphatase [Paenibacillus pectinilyticus]|uniref:Nucleotide pyrophosphatase n=1 Tax=Paenibacillus pectinilyticus TaxID=512399 RepID=A0A1C0ZTG2_9BACL|nr:alkaline phosphatase family protein [Paenibacillus pectinilyticus]OCT11359.1 nucleotide pyrophosphatase [Paenibacillus pectinilyticus]
MNTCQRVIIIGWDGAGTFVRDAHTPNLDRLFATGAHTLEAQTASPTISAECWGSLLHGVNPVKHGLNNNKAGAELFPDDSPYPSIFRVAREAFPHAQLAAYSAWKPINDGIIEPSIDVHKISIPDGELVHAIATYIEENPDFKLLYVQLDLPDAAGHQHGYNTPGQLRAIEETDRHMGVIIEALVEADLLKDSLIIAVTDHGGGGEDAFNHGSDHPLDKTIFWGCAGPGIVPGTQLAHVDIADTAAVVAHALGLEAPASWEAKLPVGLFHS